MSTVAVDDKAGKRFSVRLAVGAFWTIVLGVALFFVAAYAFRYYLYYDQASFTRFGSPNFWSDRGWVLLHISGAMVALLTGPCQFWSGFRRKHMRLHRWTGRLFLLGVLTGSIGALSLEYKMTAGWAVAFGSVAINLAWVSTATVSYYAIRKGEIQTHREWMVRAYIVTFSFVTFRLINDFGPTSRVQPDTDRVLTYLWACWAIPLLVAEVVMQLKRTRIKAAPRPARTAV